MPVTEIDGFKNENKIQLYLFSIIETRPQNNDMGKAESKIMEKIYTRQIYFFKISYKLNIYCYMQKTTYTNLKITIKRKLERVY